MKRPSADDTWVRNLRLCSARAGVSTRSLEAILMTLQQDGKLDETPHRSALDSTTRAFFEQLQHSEEFDLTDGKKFTWKFCNPSLMVAALLEEPSFRSAFQKAWQTCPCSRERPWRLCVAFDEYSPGNALKIDNKRKVAVISFTFLELGGTEAWSNEALWCPAFP